MPIQINLKNPRRPEYILLLLVFVLCFLLFRSCSKNSQLRSEMHRQILINKQNQRALSDSVKYLKNRAGEDEASKSSFVSELRNLKELNKQLYEEVRKEIGNVRSLIKSGLDIDRGEITISNQLIKYPGNQYGLSFRDVYSDSAVSWIISGQSKFGLENNTIFPGNTTINQNSIKAKLVMGFKENNDNYEVWARSASPLVKFRDLDGVIIIPKKADITCPPTPRKKRFGFGPYIGIGIGSNLKTDFSLGLGLSYSLLRF